MNGREKTLLIALIVVVGFPGLIYAGKRFWFDPLMVYRDQRQKLESDVELANLTIDDFLDGQKRLNKARERSLPADTELAAAEYHRFIRSLLVDSGLTVLDTTPGQSIQQKMKPVTPIQGVTAVGHKILNFTVRANGELSALVTAMERMQLTPYEHRIKSLTVDRSETSASKKSNSKLDIQMNIELLLVAGTKNKPGAPLKKELVEPGPDSRVYSQIPYRNIFEGALPPPIIVDTKSKDKEIVKEKPPDEPTENTPEFVYLTHTSPDEQIAYMRNRVYDRSEMKLWAKAGSGYDTFKITDEFGDHVFFRAKVLRVELRRVFIQIKDEVYTVSIGHSLAEMERYGFNKSRIELEDEGLFDRDFWEQERGKGSKKDTKDTKSKGTKKKGG